ncbi:hypothetical protein RvY_00214-2 [Ramazzottius varieornatus]|uniref:Uncharacterized protein n=1 Tax=Ramazzottius varieornatus TaxID=947166 RepID=A0A1D1UCF4_RAMVA|nr:hypothetical protein RvY_00214-2 [Ramazzottius varieornatus]
MGREVMTRYLEYNNHIAPFFFIGMKLRREDRFMPPHVDGCVNPGITKIHMPLLLNSPEHLFIQWLQESCLSRRENHYLDFLLMLHTCQEKGDTAQMRGMSVEN